MERRKRQCEDSYYEFLKDAFVETHPGEIFKDNWHIKFLCDIAQVEAERIGRDEKKTFDIIVNIPPRSLKSFIFTVALAPWAWIKFPHLKHFSSSYSADLSIEHNVMARDIIETDWYRNNWGDKVVVSPGEDTKSKFKNTGGGNKRATSTGGGIHGKGGDIIVPDDSLNPKKAASEVERKAAIDHYDIGLSTRLDHPEIGMYIIVEHRLHEEDLTGHCLKQDPNRYMHICIPAELSENVKPAYLREFYKDGLFFPSRFSIEYLNRQKIALGTSGYQGQYNQTPIAEGGNTILNKWFGRFELNDLPKNIPWNFVIDGAYTEKKTNSASVLMCYTMYHYDLYIKDVASVWMAQPDFLRFIKDFAYRNNYNRRSRIYIEPKANGISTAQTLRRYTKLNIILDKPPTVDKVSRVNASLPFLEARRAYLLEGASWIDSFLYETGMFPNAKQDGQVDCLCMAADKVSNPKSSVKFHYYDLSQTYS